MAQFSYNQYQQVVAQAQANGEGSPKIGFFKLKDDGHIAVARLNIGSTDELMFASVHTIGSNGKWTKVSCLNPLGMHNGECALCSAHVANPKGTISKAAKKVFIPMIVSYRDPNAATGYTAPAPVIWDRPAAFSRELANKLMVAGNLRDTLVLITRNGKAGDMQTTYSMDILPANHPVFKPEMIPNDFSAFNNFNIARHSYWEKTAEEINAYLATGQFPERGQNAAQAAPAAAPAYVAPATIPVQPAYSAPTAEAPSVVNTPVYTAPTAAAPTANPASAAPVTETPQRNFTGFSF